MAILRWSRHQNRDSDLTPVNVAGCSVNNEPVRQNGRGVKGKRAGKRFSAARFNF